eukprot:CAMPEP_0185786130 /NCGR_PEP_ID=MMETSP1174-20130828/133709_1 /TAXON_ID=35687 /ORGANISM="Dictyocha speculum, Strain CCMP1381" /LENGTH=184 /DNA_ID=CAMNT_0028478603 /DNA_START=48 /DNA_END=598 /DNA_ORIENTATION=+
MVHAAVQRFSTDPDRRVLLLSSRSAASGVNLQCANHVLLLEPPGTNPMHALSVETQAIGRTLRLGQTKRVHVAHFVFEDTAEAHLYAALERARNNNNTDTPTNTITNTDTNTSNQSASVSAPCHPENNIHPPSPAADQSHPQTGGGGAATARTFCAVGGSLLLSPSPSPATSSSAPSSSSGNSA